MTQSMVERVSRAIAWASLADDEQARFAAGNPDRMWVDPKFVEHARAAIAAMREPTEAMWSGLARHIILWDRQANPGGDKLYKQLKMTGCPVPEWLPTEIPNTGHCPSKGNVAVAIWKAMHDEALRDG